jgi:hypothetical protein
MAEKIKQKGNELFKQQKYQEAIDEYTKALKISHGDAILLSNRSIGYWKIGQYQAALTDAESCIAAKPDWVKGYLRKAVALNSLERYDQAKEAATKGFSFNDLKFTKEFVHEWLKASKAMVSDDISSVIKRYHNFYPDGIDLINDEYCNILKGIILSLVPSLQLQGILGLSHDDMCSSIDKIVELLQKILAEFGQTSHADVFSEWKNKLKINVDAFNLLSSSELMESLDKTSLAVASWLHEELHSALVPVVAPIVLLIPLAVLSRSLCLRCINTGHFTLEYLAHGTLALFEDSIFDKPFYIATYIQLLFLILHSHGSIEIWTPKMLELVQVTIIKIQRLIEIMPCTTKNYSVIVEEYTGILSVFLDMKITQISESEFKHDPGGSAGELEELLLFESSENPLKARVKVDDYLQKINRHFSNEDKSQLISKVQELFFIVGILIKLNDAGKALEIYEKGSANATMILKNIAGDSISSLDEVSAAVGSMRHFALCGASFLIASQPRLVCDAFLKWKNLYSEALAILIRLGLRANNRTLFQVLSHPLIQRDEKYQMEAFQFHQRREKIFVEKYLPHVFHALMAQSIDKVAASIEATDIILDYVFDIFHPNYNRETEQKTNAAFYVCVIGKYFDPKIFEIDVTPIHSKFSGQSGKPMSFKEIETLCKDLSEVIFPPDVRKILDDKNVTRLFLCADSYLHDIPIEACSWKVSENDEIIRLCQKFDIVRISSPRELLRENVIASLRLIFSPSLEPSERPVVINIDEILKALKSYKSEVAASSQHFMNKAIAWCGYTLESLNLENKHLSALSYSKYHQDEISSNLLQAMQHSIDLNKESMQNRSNEFNLQFTGQLSYPTYSLNAKCYLIGNPKYELDNASDNGSIEEPMGCIASLISHFGLAQISDKPSVVVDDLPETQREIDTIQYILSLNPFLDILEPITREEATVGKILSLESPFILHIATHGHLKSTIHTQGWNNYWSDTSAALLMAGSKTYLNGDYSKLNFHINIGCLTPTAVCATNLEGSRLVFLSTCRSGIGVKPFHETSQSILQAFRGAGAQNVISTLWSVNDSTTADFASFFYNHLLADPSLRLSHALSLTQRHLLEQNEDFSVYAAFTCSGIDLPLHPSAPSEAQSIQILSDYIQSKYHTQIKLHNVEGFEGKACVAVIDRLVKVKVLLESISQQLKYHSELFLYIAAADNSQVTIKLGSEDYVLNSFNDYLNNGHHLIIDTK